MPPGGCAYVSSVESLMDVVANMQENKKIITLAGVIIVLSDDLYLLLQIRLDIQNVETRNDNS